MKRTHKLLSLLLALMLLVGSVATLSVSAAGDTVYVKVPSNYGTPYCYMWNSASDQDAGWPGTQMTAEGDGVYSYTPSKSFANVIFNNGSGTQTDDLVYPGANQIYDLSANTWSVYDPSSAEPTITISKKDGSSFKTESVTVTVTVKNADSAYYTVDGGAQKTIYDTAEVTLGASTAVGGTTTLFVSATNANGTVTQSATYTKKDASSSGGNTSGTTSAPLDGYYSTNPNGQVGKKANISIDGSISDWNSSMLIAQGTANDDPRVYRPNSMYEVGIDLYALYGAYDDNNLYLMWEMTNVQDVVAPNDNYPLSQGVLWQTQELPFFIAVDTGDADTAIGEKGALTTGGTIWDSGMTFENGFNKLISINTKGGNGPWVYGGDETGLNPVEILTAATSKIDMGFGLGILSDNVYGINGAYGEYNNRIPGDIADESSDWVDFNTKGHKSSTMDFFYELSIPFSELGIDKSDVETNGVGVMVVATMGKSAMDCLPGDLAMTDQAHLDDAAGSQEFNSFEKSDSDHISVPFARIGKLQSENTTPTTKPTQPTQPTTQTEPTSTKTEPTTAKPQPTQTTTQSSGGTDAKYFLGDADMNGTVNVKDATLIQKATAGLVSAFRGEAFICADADINTEVNVKDATIIQKFVAGLT
ncbi:MAG: starch-binding protein, partial [Clostridia bacterium]|nr:starch-binding protein [Clostridia bacterium]